MAVTYHYHIFVTFLLSCLSIALLIGSFATERWLESEYTKDGEKNFVNFGLFQGEFERKTIIINTVVKKIYMECVFENNICAFSCEENSEKRKNEIQSIYDGTFNVSICSNSVTEKNNDITWYNSGVYLSTLIFLGLALCFAILCALLGVYNATKSPVEPLLSVFGLYIWHGCSVVCSSTALILWGVHYAINLQEQLGFTYTMIQKIDTTTFVGYSFWFVLASTMCHIISEVLLFYRLWRIKTEPAPMVINPDNDTDNTIFLY